MRALLVFVLLLVSSIANAVETAPRFADYPVVGRYEGRNAAPIFDSEYARTYRTRIRDAARNMRPNFAGEFIITTWGCGTSCEQITIINARTGQVIKPSISALAGETIFDLGQKEDYGRVVSSVNSRLLLVKGKTNEDQEFDGYRYFTFNGQNLNHLRTIIVKPKQESAAVVSADRAPAVMANQAPAEDVAQSPLRQWTGAISAAVHGRMNASAATGTSGGSVLLRFTVLQSGEVKDARVVGSSGVDQLDQDALATVQGRLPAAPSGVTQQSLSVSMPLNYRLRQTTTATADPACQWSKSMRLDQSIKCPNDGAPPVYIKNRIAVYGQPAVDIDSKTGQPLRDTGSRPSEPVGRVAAERDGKWDDGPPPNAVAGPPIPDHDVDGICGKLEYSQSRAYCVRSEQSSYDLLKSLWQIASSRAKTTSIRYASAIMNKPPYYESLLTYLQSEMKRDETETDRVSPPRFQR